MFDYLQQAVYVCSKARVCCLWRKWRDRINLWMEGWKDKRWNYCVSMWRSEDSIFRWPWTIHWFSMNCKIVYGTKDETVCHFYNCLRFWLGYFKYCWKRILKNSVKAKLVYSFYNKSIITEGTDSRIFLKKLTIYMKYKFNDSPPPFLW